MRLVITGGGTGGHVFPALEVGLTAKAQGWEVVYMGSLRGQEGPECQKVGMSFRGFSSEPLYRLSSMRGVRAALNLARATLKARSHMRAFAPDVVFSTGGYASAPVLASARKLGVPHVVHEQNVVAGRTNRIFAKSAYAVATVFRGGGEQFFGAKVVRTGMPIRKAFREGHQGSLSFGRDSAGSAPLLLVVGGSQGATALNDATLAAAVRMASPKARWLLVAGPNHYEGLLDSVRRMAVKDTVEIRAFLDANEMAQAMFECDLCICRSGAGTLAELAAFRKPSVLVPYPAAFGNHQLHNAKEFEAMGAASVLPQEDLQASTLEARVQLWLSEPDRRLAAESAMAEWSVPDSIDRVLALLREAGESK